MRVQAVASDENYVSTEVLRQAFADSRLTAYELAMALDWYDSRRGDPDSNRVKRTLGINSQHLSSQGSPNRRQRVSVDLAGKMVVAMGLLPYDYGF